MTKPLRGVNLGGWLLLEKWMTPSLFAGTNAIDEYTFMQTTDASQKIEQHRATFITEEDFAWLQAHGVTAVRVPVGYWALHDDAPFTNVKKYLDWAMNMAAKYKLQVVIDLHGVKGSQNGYDHSGRVGRAKWFRTKAYRDETIDVLEAIAARYRDYDNFWGLQILNEPRLGLFHWKLRRYYKAAYARLVRILQPHTRIIYSDAFTPRLLSGLFGSKPVHPVVMDVHIYHMTTFLSQYAPVSWFLEKTHWRKHMLQRLSKAQPIIIGEWSGVMRAKTMRHVPRSERDVLFAEYVALQQEVFDETAGWFYWSYKTEKPGQWNFRSEVEAGRIIL